MDQDHEKVRKKAGFESDADNLKPVVGFVVHTDETQQASFKKERGQASTPCILQARNQNLLESQDDLLVATWRHGDKG